MELIHSIKDILDLAVEEKASDVLIVKGMPLAFKVNGVFLERSSGLKTEDTEILIHGLYSLADGRDINILKDAWDDDFAFSLNENIRIRANTFYQKGACCAVLRILMTHIPNPESINIPKKVIDYAKMKNGLILFTGETGSGKSTSQACMIDFINQNMNKHIITLEDPVEYTHVNKKSIVTQREILSDSKSFAIALKAALRQCPDVILVGEMRDSETIETALTAAETGHLVISTLHTMDAANAIGRVIDAFPKDQAQYIAALLSGVLRCVVFQQLIPSVDGKLVPLFEILEVNEAIRGLISDGNARGIRNYIDQNPVARITTSDYMLVRLFVEKKITEETLFEYAKHKDWMKVQYNLIQNGVIPDHFKQSI